MSGVQIPPGMQRIFPLNSHFLEGSKDLCTSTETRGSTIVTGQANMCKTPLLFQFAVSHATDGSTVVFITHQPFGRIPRYVHGMPRPNPTTARKIKMIYYSSLGDLVTYLSSIHQGAAPPDVLILDDLHHYVNQMSDGGGERALARLSALLIDAAHFMKSKSPAVESQLLVATQPTCPAHLQIIQHFFTTVYSIKESPPKDGSESCYQMAAVNGSSSPSTDATFRFYRQNDQIYLRDVCS